MVAPATLFVLAGRGEANAKKRASLNERHMAFASPLRCAPVHSNAGRPVSNEAWYGPTCVSALGAAPSAFVVDASPYEARLWMLAAGITGWKESGFERPVTRGPGHLTRGPSFGDLQTVAKRVQPWD